MSPLRHLSAGWESPAIQGQHASVRFRRRFSPVRRSTQIPAPDPPDTIGYRLNRVPEYWVQTYRVAMADHRLGGGQPHTLGEKVGRLHNFNGGAIAFLHMANFSPLGEGTLLYRLPAFYPVKSIDGLRQISDNGKGAAGKQFLQREKRELSQILRFIHHYMAVTGIILRTENPCFQVDQRGRSSWATFLFRSGASVCRRTDAANSCGR